jgi:hypothetical protein
MSGYLNASDANGTIYGSNSDDQLGFSVANAGDVNNDTYDDVIVGAPGYALDKGRAYIFYGCNDMRGWGENSEFAHWDEDDSADYNPPGYGIYKNQWLAQSFTPNDDYYITKVAMYIQRNGTSPGTLAISLQGDSTGPDDNILTYAPIISNGPTSLTWVEIEFIEPYQVSSGIKYWIVAAGTGNNALNCWEWLEDDDTGTDYTGGNGAYSGGSGKPWTMDALTSDYWFKVYGCFPAGLPANVTLTGGSIGDDFGLAVAGAGDIGGDGYCDVIVGAPGTTNGSVYLINGSKIMKEVIVTGKSWGDEKKFAHWDNGGDMELVVYNDTVGNSQSLAQSFIPPVNYNLTSVRLFIEEVGIPGSITVKLMGSTGTSPDTVPNNIVLATTNSHTGGNKSYCWEEFVFTTPYVCQAGIEYFIVAYGTGTGISNSWVWFVQATGRFKNGDYAFEQGSGWNAGVRDCYFEAYGRPETVSPNITIEGNPGDKFGSSVSSAGDLNDDGYDDIIIGAPYNDSLDGSVTDSGAVYLFLGSPIISNKTVSEVDNVTYGETAFDRLGWSVGAAGDFNGDGDSDIIIGVPYFDNNSKIDAGKIYIMCYDYKSIVPEFSLLILPVFLIILIIAVVRKKYYFSTSKKEVVK